MTIDTMREFLNSVITFASEVPNFSIPVITKPNTAEPTDEITADDIKDYAEKQLNKLNERNANRKATPTKTQIENERLKAEIINSMTADTVYISSVLATTYGVSTQKISALMKQLVDEGKVIIIDDYKPEGSKSKVKGYKVFSE